MLRKPWRMSRVGLRCPCIQGCVWLRIYYLCKSKERRKGEKKRFSDSSVQLVVTPSFLVGFLSWSQSVCAGDEARKAGQTSAHTHTYFLSFSVVVVPFSHLHHFNHLGKRNTIQNSILLCEEYDTVERFWSSVQSLCLFVERRHGVGCDLCLFRDRPWPVHCQPLLPHIKSPATGW